MRRFSIHLDHSLECEAGGSLLNPSIVYYASKEKPHKGDKIIAICHALTANANPEDWWPQMVGPGKYLDSDKYFIFCVSMLASPYGECGPKEMNPDTGRPSFFDFPTITVRDMVKASEEVRHFLGIDSIDLIIGSSIGGFQAMEWVISCPELFKKAVFIATSPRISPWLLAGVETQKMALEADPSFRKCESIQGGAAGLKCARAQALISYRCSESYALTQSEDDEDILFADKAASYERYQGEKLVRRQFDAYSYYYLCVALSSHNIGRGRGGVEKTLSSIRTETMVVAIDTDVLFSPEVTKEWSVFIPGAEYVEITSKFGHDGFLLESEQITGILKKMI